MSGSAVADREWRRSALATGSALAVGVSALSGCGLGPGGAAKGPTSLTVTRGFGSQRLTQSKDTSVRESDTVMRLLDRRAKVRTRYGGRFVEAIDGLAGASSGTRRYDWFFYVNGIESATGAAEARVHPGDRIWWDYREWTAAMRVPAVVGSWPEPFAHGSGGRPFPVRIDCLGPQANCRRVADRLAGEGVDANIGFARARVGKETLRILVGPWAQVRQDIAASRLSGGPDRSGVFASFAGGDGGFKLRIRDGRGRQVRRLGPGAALVAAVREGEQQPTWLVTGTDQAGADHAVRLLSDRALRDRYAVAAPRAGKPVGVPLR